jgi:DNA polymerase-3 subunit beta
MQFTIDAKRLAGALRKVKGATEKRNTMPILSSVVIDAIADSVTFSATDLEVGIQVTEKVAPNIALGSVVLPLDKLLKVARKLKGWVSFEALDNDYVAIGCEASGSKVTLAGNARAEYPILPGEPDRVRKVTGKALGEAISTVLHAASKDETRYNLNGIYIDADSKPTVRVIATDGHRLAVADAGPMLLPWEGGVIVPAKAAKLLVGFLKGEGSVAVAADAQSIRVSGDSWAVSIRLIEGEYPNYEQVIPETSAEYLTADTDTFTAAVGSALEMSAERSRAIKFVLNGGLELHSNNPDLGNAVVDCPCERSGYRDLTLAFNGRYITDAVTAVCGGRVRIDFRGKDPETSPVKISGSEPFPFAVVMPMRV